MTLRQSHNYIASTETVPADSLTWYTVGLAKLVILNGQAGINAYRPTYDSDVEPTDQLFDRHQFPMPTAAL